MSSVVGVRPPSEESRRAGYLTLLVVAVCLAAGLATGMNDGTLALGALAAAAGALYLFGHPLVGALVLVSAVPALSGLDRGIPVPGFRVSEVLIVGIAALTMITTSSDPWRAFDWASLAYVLGTVAFGLIDVSGVGGSGLSSLSGEEVGKLVGPLEFFLLYRAVRALSRSRDTRRVIMRWALAASVPISLLALMQFAGVPGTRALAVAYAGEIETLEAHSTFYRATALFSQGHLLSAYLMLVLLIAVAYLFDSKPTPFERRTMLAIVGLDVVAIGATSTVTPILGLIAGVLALALWYRRLGRAMLALTGAALIAIVIFGPTITARIAQEYAGPGASGGAPQTLSYRAHVWTSEYLPTIGQHLATGYGPGLPPGSIWPYTESAYITILLRGGLPLLLIFAWLMWIMARHSLAVADDRRPVARAMFVTIVALTVMHLVANYFFNAGFPQLWWGVAGVLMGGTAQELKGGDASGAVSKPVRKTERAAVPI
jgi:hypothetical protein